MSEQAATHRGDGLTASGLLEAVGGRLSRLQPPSESDARGLLSDPSPESCPAGFEPLRLQLLQRLHQRALASRPAVAERLLAKVSGLLDAYEQDWQQARTAAETALAAVATHFPDAQAAAAACVQQHDFGGAVRLLAACQRHAQPRQTLRQLVEQRVNAEVVQNKAPTGLALDEFLQAQEQEIMRACCESAALRASELTALSESELTALSDSKLTALSDSKLTALSDSKLTALSGSELTALSDSELTALDEAELTAPSESANLTAASTQVPGQAAGPEVKAVSATDSRPALKSARVFRQAKAEKNTDILLDMAIKTGPEAPGPLNPEMLAIRSLTTMRDLSPQYLNRFVTYIDTLLWIDSVDAGQESGAAANGAAGTAKRGAKAAKKATAKTASRPRK